MTEASLEVSSRARWSRWTSMVVAGGLYVALSLALWFNVWTKSPTSTTICGCSDSSFTLWFQAFAAHALAEASNPFFTTLLWHPHGINVLDDASQLAIGLPLAPVTWLVGSVASMNLALTASTVLSAIAMYVLLDGWDLWRPGAFVGGLLYGFSPMVLTNLAEARLVVTMLVIPPLIVWCLDRLARPPARPGRLGVMLGLLVVIQFFISIEVLVLTALACALGLVAVLMAGIVTGDLVRARVRSALAGMVVAGVTAGVLLAYPGWFVLFGPGHIAGRVYPSATLGVNGATALGFIWPRPPSAAFMAYAHRVGGYQGPMPSSQYVGITMVVLVVAGVMWFRRDRRLWLFSGIGLVFGALAFGSSSGGWSPWAVLANAPIFENVIPIRLLLVTFFCLGVVVAVLADLLVQRLGAAPGGLPPGLAARWGMVVLVVALVPSAAYYRQMIPLATQPVTIPTWFTSVAPRLPAHQVLFVIPAPFSIIQSSLTWQSQAHLRFSMAGGDGPGSDLAFAGRHRLAQELLSSVSGSFTPVVVTPTGILSVRQAFDDWHVDLAVMPVQRDLPSYDQPFQPVQAAALVTAALGEVPRYQAGSLVWKVSGDASDPRPAAAQVSRCSSGAGITPLQASICVLQG